MTDERGASGSADASTPETRAQGPEDGATNPRSSTTIDHPAPSRSVSTAAVVGALLAGVAIGSILTIAVYAVRGAFRTLAGHPLVRSARAGRGR
jgi:hypothetical protein